MTEGVRLSPKHGVNPMVLQCPLCGGDAGIALLGKLPNDAEAPRKGTGTEPCDECKKLMAMGFLLIEVKDGSTADPYRTGRIWVVSDEYAKKICADMSRGAAYIEESTTSKLGFPKPDEESPLP